MQWIAEGVEIWVTHGVGSCCAAGDALGECVRTWPAAVVGGKCIGGSVLIPVYHWRGSESEI